MKVVLDTSFLSSLFKVGRLGLVRDFFGASSAYIPDAVFKELSKTNFFKDFITLIASDDKKADKERWVVVLDSEGIEGIELGSGEKAAIALAKRLNGVLLIDDRKAKMIAKEHGIKAYDLHAFLYSCKKRGIVDKNAMADIIQDLKAKDYYEFKASIEKELLK